MSDGTKLNSTEELENIIANKDEILRISSDELKIYMKCFRTLFAAVRILDDDCMHYSFANEDGTLQEKREHCYEIWKRSGRCAKCISLQALKTKKVEHKFQVFEDEAYIVYAMYLEVDGEPKIVELLNPVGQDKLHGFQNEPTLLEILKDENEELFMDSQLIIYNRRFFEEHVDKLKNITALAMLDIDEFKKINDTYGHVIGDCVLKAVADAVKSDIRENDYLIRMGGDEMMICFSGMKAHKLDEKLEEIRADVENALIPEREDVHFTVSIGGLMCEGYSDMAREKADEALYEGKRRKNTVVTR